MQLRFETGLTSEEYVNRQGWREASLERCPLHPGGGCGFARHGTYGRARPAGTRIARWYCPQGHRTFSLLPDCLAARLGGSLVAVERVVIAVEQASSLEAAADRLRPEVELPGAIRWTRHRVRRIHAVLTVLRGLDPVRFGAWPLELGIWRERLGITPVLPALRGIAADYLHHLSAPVGFRPVYTPGGESQLLFQHPMGPDPPPGFR